MKVLLAALGSAGDVHPPIAIGVELRRRGHAVTLVANAWFQATAHRAGLAFVPAGTVDDYRRAVANPDLWDSRKGFALIVRGQSINVDGGAVMA